MIQRISTFFQFCESCMNDLHIVSLLCGLTEFQVSFLAASVSLLGCSAM